MKKIVFMLIAALGVALVGCSCFDSEPLEPEIIGSGQIAADEGVYYVEIGSTRYAVKKVYTGERKLGYTKIKPVVGMPVTAVELHNCSYRLEGNRTYFMLGEWNKAQIEATFHTNYSFITFFGILIIFGFAYVLLSEHRHEKKSGN